MAGWQDGWMGCIIFGGILAAWSKSANIEPRYKSLVGLGSTAYSTDYGVRTGNLYKPCPDRHREPGEIKNALNSVPTGF